MKLHTIHWEKKQTNALTYNCFYKMQMIDLGLMVSKRKTHLCKHLRPKLPGRWIMVEQTLWAAGNKPSTLAPTEAKGQLADGIYRGLEGGAVVVVDGWMYFPFHHQVPNFLRLTQSAGRVWVTATCLTCIHGTPGVWLLY
jgi:hypothetical protein